MITSSNYVDVRAAFVKECSDANGKIQSAVETQTACVLAIAFDLLPATLSAGAGENLALLVREAEGRAPNTTATVEFPDARKRPTSRSS